VLFVLLFFFKFICVFNKCLTELPGEQGIALVDQTMNKIRRRTDEAYSWVITVQSYADSRFRQGGP
jgi:hypothetical protein